MREKHYLAVIITAAIFILAGLGCSSGGDSPVIPGVQEMQSNGTLGGAENMQLWGLWDVQLDPATRTAEIMPLRNGEFSCNVVRFLQPPIAPQNLISISVDPSSVFPDGYVVVDVTLSHPFPGLDQFCGFDVRAAVLGNGSIPSNSDPGILYGGNLAIQLLNADGMTRWFNPSEFTTYGTIFGYTQGALGFPGDDLTATLNPYKYYAEGLGAQDDVLAFFDDPGCPNPRGLFPTTSAVTRRFELQFPLIGGAPDFKFQYAAIASWDLPSPNPPMSIPDDFPVSANCHEAYAISVYDQSDMWYNSDTDWGGSMNLVVRVFDHQGILNADGVKDEIDKIHIETPNGLITTGGIATFWDIDLDPAFVGGDDVSATFELVIPDVQPTGQGEFPILVVVENAVPPSYDPGIPGFDFPTGMLSAYVTSTVSIGPGVQSDAPVAIAEIITQPPYCPGDPIEFDASASYDPDGGSIVSYEWDFDGDGMYGDPYDSGTDAIPVKVFIDIGTYSVDVRVTDEEALTDTLDTPLSLSIGGATWVDDDADPIPADGSFEFPWPTIQEGIDNATDDCGGKWVLVKDGSYEENIVIPSDIKVEGWSDPAPLLTTEEGSEDHMVTFASAQDSILMHFRAMPKCLYDPGNSIKACGIHLGSSSNITIDDIEFLDNPGGSTCTYAITGQTWGADFCEINNVRVDGYHKTANGFISISGDGAVVTNCVLLNITFESAGGMYPLSIRDAGSTGLVAKNVIGHMTFSQAFDDTLWISGLSMSYCEGATVRNNLIFDINNTLTGGWTWGIDIGDATDMTLEHNTVNGLTGPAWIYGFEASDFNSDPSGVTHRDHIVANLTTTGTMQSWRWAYLGMWASDLPVDNSCAYNCGHGFYTGIHEVVEGVDFTYLDPKFMDPAGDDFRLQPVSPCVGTAHDGTDMGAYGGPDPLTWVP